MFSISPGSGTFGLDNFVVTSNPSFMSLNQTTYAFSKTGFIVSNASLFYLEIPFGRESFEIEAPCASASYMDMTYFFSANVSFLSFLDSGSSAQTILIDQTAIDFGSANFLVASGSVSANSTY